MVMYDILGNCNYLDRSIQGYTTKRIHGRRPAFTAWCLSGEKHTEKQERAPQNQSLNREKRIPAGDSAQRDGL